MRHTRLVEKLSAPQVLARARRMRWSGQRLFACASYELDWKRRVLWARVTRKPINCGTMPPGYYP